MTKAKVIPAQHGLSKGGIKKPRKPPTQKQLDALKPTQWKKGQSGNPAGRKPGVVLSDAYRRLLSQPFPVSAEAAMQEMISHGASVAEVLAMIMVKHVVRGSVSAAMEIRRATEGDTVNVNSEWRVAAEEAGIDASAVMEILANGIKERL